LVEERRWALAKVNLTVITFNLEAIGDEGVEVGV
jgi:hypothetical protein